MVYPRDEVRKAVDELLRTHTGVTSRMLAERLGVSRQSAHQHLVAAVHDGWLMRVGAGRAVRYVRTQYEARYEPAGLDEEAVWQALEPHLSDWCAWSPAGRSRLHYALTEMVNNAIDHAEGTEIRVSCRLVDSMKGGRLELVVEDDGIGALAKASRGLKISRPAEVIVEIAKGKRTTAPEAHSGEGLFFTSKVAELFRLEANGFAWVVDNEQRDEGILTSEIHRGTRVTLWLDPLTEVPLEHVFAQFTNDFRFTKSRVRIKLLEMGDVLMSRSQAKRLCARLESFEEVELDFAGVAGVGQGFVDEVFRVWAKAHVGTQLIPTSMNEAVRFMVERGLRRDERSH